MRAKRLRGLTGFGAKRPGTIILGIWLITSAILKLGENTMTCMFALFLSVEQFILRMTLIHVPVGALFSVWAAYAKSNNSLILYHLIQGKFKYKFYFPDDH